jgi:hypothetical protein
MGFEDLDDLNEFDEMPPFEEDLDIPGFDDGGDEGSGLSRTFKILGAVLVLLVLGIVGVLLVLTLNDDDGPSANQQTATAISGTNAAVATGFHTTQTAIAAALDATRTSIAQTETAAANEIATQTAIANEEATAAVERATAEFEASATAAAEATASQEAADQAATLTATAGVATTPEADDGSRPGSMTIQIYRDDGDGVFTPQDVTIRPGADAGEGPSVSVETAEVESLSYGDTVQGTLEQGISDDWTFEGTAGDMVTINAIAGDAVQMDMFLTLTSPDGATVIEDDDGGEGLNAAIIDYELPADGQYTIRVSSVAGPGDYTLTLASGSVPDDAAATEAAPEDAVTEEAGMSFVPRVRAANPGPVDLLVQVRRQGTPTPEDILLNEPQETDLLAAIGDEVDFTGLEPGVYWMVIDYPSLPESLRAIIPARDEVLFRVDVSETGDLSFTVILTPTTSEVGETEEPETVEPAGTEEVGAGEVLSLTPTPQVMPDTGIFSDAGNGDIDGSSGLIILGIAAVGLVAVVFIARKLRSAP